MNRTSLSSVDKRVQALANYDVMDTEPEPEFDDLTQLVSQICETPISTITLLDRRRQWFKSRRGIVHSETPIEHAFCAHAIHRADEVMVVHDARRDERFRRNPFVTGDPGIRFYAGAPLVTPEGIPIGTICAIDYKNRGLKPGQRAALRTLSRQAMALLELRRAHRHSRLLQDETLTEAERMSASLQALATTCAELRISEAYFRHLTEHALDLITILDSNGTIRFESRSIELELGYAPEHYRGRSAFDFVHPEDRPIVMNAFKEALERRGNTPLIRFRFLHADGSFRVLEGTGNNLVDDPVVGGIVFNSRDVTERVRLQKEVECARVDKEDTVARLTGGVAHDFNNILTAIQGLAEIAERRLGGTPEAEYLTGIRASAHRASALTQQLLAISRRVVLQPCPIALRSWLEALVPRIHALIGPQITLTITVHGELTVWQDPDQLEQVILQLATNAAEAMPASGHLVITARPVALGQPERPVDDRPGDVDYIKLTVSDDGPGMNEETLARIFEPFFTTRTAGNHSGLGLSMCRGIVEQSGGHLTAQSQLGEGTALSIHLLATNTVPDLHQNVPAPLSAVAGVPTILFVDDEPMLRDIGEAILSEAGYRVIVAEDGPSALARLAELSTSPLDLLLTDVVMPGMNGVQVAAEVERLRPGTRVLLCSGYTRDALAANGLPPGVAFLSKPYTLAGLLEKVTALLSSP